MRILVLHGPNLNLLGSREPGLYGRDTLSEIDAELQQQAERLGAELVCFQSNHLWWIRSASEVDGILIKLVPSPTPPWPFVMRCWPAVCGATWSPARSSGTALFG